MTKPDYIQYWKETAEKDWEAVESLFEKGNYVHALFWAHLVLEKLLKAHWVKDNQDNFPPKVHNLKFLAEVTSLHLSDDQFLFLMRMNDYQMEGRYPDYQFRIYRILNETRTKNILEEVDKMRLWLLNELVKQP